MYVKGIFCLQFMNYSNIFITFYFFFFLSIQTGSCWRLSQGVFTVLHREQPWGLDTISNLWLSKLWGIIETLHNDHTCAQQLTRSVRNDILAYEWHKHVICVHIVRFKSITVKVFFIEKLKWKIWILNMMQFKSLVNKLIVNGKCYYLDCLPLSLRTRAAELHKFV